MQNSPPRLSLPNSLVERMVAAARGAWPNECCGLLAGRAGVACELLPLENIADTPATRFESCPRGMLAAMRELAARDLDIVAVYHSHPSSPARPSATDHEWNYAAGVFTVIISLATEPPDVRAWLLDTSEPAEIALCIITD